MDRNQEAIANLNSTSPITFPDALSAEDLARDLDLFTNTQFFDFDFGQSSAFSPLESAQKPEQSGDGNQSHLISSTHDHESLHSFNFISGDFIAM
jgi:hypothetical protein